MNVSIRDYSALANACGALLSVCDGAAAIDGSGFNKFDSPFARQLAALGSENWTSRQARALYFTMRKYSGQLSGMGISYDDIAEPAVIEDERVAKAQTTCTITYERVEESIKDFVFVIRFGYNPTVVNAVKEIPTRRFVNIDKDTKFWVVRIDPQSLEPLVQFAINHNFDVSPEAREIIGRAFNEYAENREASRAADADIDIEGLGGELMPFQRGGVAYASRVKRTFIADEQGLGKTVQALATFQSLQSFPALVVCPASLKLNWEREAHKWLPGKTVSVLTSSGPNRWRADVFIANYDILADKWEDAKNADGSVKKNNKGKVVKQIKLSSVGQRLFDMGLAAIAFDEFHYCMTATAQRSAACEKLASCTDVRLGLTGTPIQNRPKEIVHQLTILGRIDEFGGSWKFLNRYCGAQRGSYGWDMNGATNLEELNEKLRAICFIRRLKSEVLTELPPKRRTILELEISNRKEYAVAERNIVQFIKNMGELDDEFTEYLETLPEEDREDAIREYRAKKAKGAESCEALVKIEALKQLAAKGKMAAVTKWIEDFVASGEKLVLFASHVEICKKFAKELGAPLIIGATKLEDRQRAVDQFQNDPNCRVIVGNIKAMGVGLTLTAASNVAFVEFGWNPGEMNQAEDRCHRIGQHDSVNCWYLAATETIDEDIIALIESKRVVVDAATEGHNTGAASSVFNDLIKKMKAKAA